MLDLFHVPGNDGVSTQDVFYGQSASTINALPWYKPRGASMCHIFMVGGGGAGGSGFIGSASAAGGGGGGGSGAQVSMTFPLWALPDVLFVFIGLGGQAVVNANGGSGQASSICTALPASNAKNFLLNATGGGGGNVGAATGATLQGTGGGATTIASAPYALLGGLVTTNINLIGQAGGPGGTATTADAGTNTSYPTTGLCISGGAGGGAIGTTGNGGAGGFISQSLSWGVLGGIVGGVASSSAGGNGNAGVRWQYSNDKRLLNSGGTGGAGSAFNSATFGGNGGDGGYGSGGGGGGAVLTGGVAGRGGNGGPGLVIITCY